MRWSCLCLAAFLALAPVCAYAQCHYDDYDPVRLPVSAHNMDDSLPVWPSSPTAEQLVLYTQELAGCPYLKADITNADWEVIAYLRPLRAAAVMRSYTCRTGGSPPIRPRMPCRRYRSG